MAALRLELEISAVDPSGDMVFVEGRGPGGVQVGLLVAPGTLPVRAGQRLTMSLEAPAQPAPSMRERMSKPAATTAAPTSAAAPAVARTAAGATTPGVTDVVLSAILGSMPSVERERDVNDEMDALFGRRR